MLKLKFGTPKPSKEKLIKKNLSKLSDYAFIEKNSEGYIYLDTQFAPFVLGGMENPKNNCGEYYRLDATKKEIYSDANRSLAACTPGGTVRFATDAEEISVRVTLRGANVGMHHFCDRGVFGIDAYIGTGTKRNYVGGQMQTFADSSSMNCGTLYLPKGIKEVMIDLPLYSGISKLEVGFHRNALIGEPTERKYKPIGFYGSSITQGGCVSRPGNSYCNVICRALDADCRNFGFSGSAMGEKEVAEYIASCEMSCFVMDYDYNSPSVEHLRSTHEPFFRIIRDNNPDLPVVFVTHPFYAKKTDDDEARIKVVRQTYKNAVSAGDKKVWFVDSSDFFDDDMRDMFTVDNLHPNDLGQMAMAMEIFPAVKKAVSK